MIQMTPYMSWSSMLVFVLLVITVIVLAVQIRRRIHFNRMMRQQPQPVGPDEDYLAEVIDIRPVAPVRHLALVPDRPAAPSLYDWSTQGL
jgi:hypothetical protein